MNKIPDPESFFDFGRSRRSVRHYSPRKIDDPTLRKILEFGTYAPSNTNSQGWRFIIIKDPEIRNKIVSMGAASFIRDAPATVLVLYENTSDNLEYMDYVQSASAAIENILLGALAYGIYGCWVCHLPSKNSLRSLLNIPPVYDPIALITLGYPVKDPKEVPRKSRLDSIIFLDKFNPKAAKLPKRKTIKQVFRKIYYALPMRKHIKPLVDKLFEKKFDN